MAEETTQQPPSEQKPIGLVDKAYEIHSKLEASIKKQEELLARQEELYAKQMLGGRSEAGIPIKAITEEEKAAAWAAQVVNEMLPRRK